MAEGGLNYEGNISGSDFESDEEDNRVPRQIREQLLALAIDGNQCGEMKNEVSREQQNEQVGTQEMATDSRNLSNRSFDIRQSRSRSFSFGRLVRRISSRRSGNIMNEAAARTQSRRNMHTSDNNRVDGNEEPYYSTADEVQRPRSVILWSRSRTHGDLTERSSRRRSSSVLDRVRRLFDSGDTENGESSTGSSLPNEGEMSEERNMVLNLDAPMRIPFPIGVNELVAIRQERARLRAEQTRIEYYFIRDLLEITNCPWYWGKINRFEAERVLDGLPDGTFLLRDSAQYQYLFSVSFRRYFRTYHARIEQWKHRYSFDKPSDYSFCSKTLHELLQHYSQAEQCMYYEPLLLNALPRKNTLPLQHLCRATICKNVSFQDVDELPIPKSLQTFLREYHYKVAVKIMEDKGTQTLAPKRKFLLRS